MLDAGYRHIDTAHMYHTELPIGRALASRFASGQLSRSDVWLTTKTSHPMLASYMSDAEQSAYDGVIGEFAGCLERLGLEYVDALLLHWPGVQANDDEALGRSKRAEMWRAAEALYASGKARSIGVSNWTEAHLEPLLAACVEPPHLNQIECHTKQQQHELVDFCQRSHNVGQRRASVDLAWRKSILPRVDGDETLVALLGDQLGREQELFEPFELYKSSFNTRLEPRDALEIV